MIEILKVLVGSRAHGLSTRDSDYDYRGVFVVPTSEILKIGGTVQATSWIEGKEDDTSWEFGKFLQMATKCNPTILEVFWSPVISATDRGVELRNLFSSVWNSRDVFNAFRGYGLNQRKKFLDDKDGRPQKFAVAYLRSLYMGAQLLRTGAMSINMENEPIFGQLKRWRNGEFTHGEVIDTTLLWEKEIEAAYKENPNVETNMDAVNDYLLSVRKEFWL